jgi:integrase
VRYDQLVDDWERWMLRRGRAPGTIKGYRWALDNFAKYAPADVRDLVPRQLESWQDLLSARGLSTGSRMMAVTAMRSLLTFAHKQRLGLNEWLPDALETIKVRYKERREIPHRDFDALVNYLSPRRPRMALTDLRTRALFFYLFYSAARVSEVLQVTRAEAEHAIIWQKGGTQKMLFVPTDAVGYVNDYLLRRDDDCPWLWVTHQTNTPIHRLQPDGVRAIWERLCRRLGIGYFTTHQIRHSYATYGRRAGIATEVRQRQLGHKDPRMMETYTHFDDDERDQAAAQMQDFVRSRIVPNGDRPPLRPRLKKSTGGRWG